MSNNCDDVGNFWDKVEYFSIELYLYLVLYVEKLKSESR